MDNYPYIAMSVGYDVAVTNCVNDIAVTDGDAGEFIYYAGEEVLNITLSSFEQVPACGAPVTIDVLVDGIPVVEWASMINLSMD